MRHRLEECQAQYQGKDQFYSFYRYFLLKLFHDGLGSPKRDDELEALLGRVPYLNGGLFELHELEKEYPKLQIPDEAFERIFSFFDEYQWHLDDRPLRSDREINPDVLGYIFEKYINQKQMGAYYTKEDITEYISKNTIIPFLFNAAEKAEPSAFRAGGAIWNLLKENPDRYIYEAVRKGVIDSSGTIIALPDEIAAGVSNVAQRGGWNRPADEEFALPTETWREFVARRDRCLEIRQKLSNGEICPIDDFITYNLDIRQFAQDVIETCDDPDLLRAFYGAISNATCLDPTCGSGAFLFAAANILEPLYDACLERMQALLDDLQRSDQKHRPEKFQDFRQTLEYVAIHPNRKYFILKSIILNNLFGVDIMREATEICKLRLFLKLVSEVEPDSGLPNYGLEPLPDIDFNIRAGNTLVGFANYEEVKQAIEGGEQKKLDLHGDMKRIDERAEIVDRAFRMFRKMQTEQSMKSGQFTGGKAELRERLRELNQELNRYLASQYGVDSNNPKAFQDWMNNHQPFHWFVEFYGIMRRGGFDVVIGNPPYIEYKKVKEQYRLLENYAHYSTNLYSACCYRSIGLKAQNGFASFIVPVSLPSTDRMQPLRTLLAIGHSVHYTSFSTRPSKLFGDAEQRLTVYVQSPSVKPQLFSGGYLKWYKEERNHLFACIDYVDVTPIEDRNNIWLKVREKQERSILYKLFQQKCLSESQMLGVGEFLYYKNTGIRYFSTVTLRPPKCWINGVPTSSSRETVLSVNSRYKHIVHSFLLSSTFFLHYQSTSNCRDLNPSDILCTPVPDLSLVSIQLENLSSKAEDDYIAKGKVLKMQNKKTGLVELESLSPANSKFIIDEIDRVLAKHYGFTDEELDFIINYDIKYRMGRDAEDTES